ncbi:cytochrome o ubiquinol oxidase subunit IV [Ferroacidibacillus organovorans]|uniref:Quinol oxidase subunit 4 n=1 Tax=Ferroacidibacillus organovorans TaxID=1765683 RepID=A0A162S3K6_9BACL|nr:cytochrome C oxidase subunit IV family protein [Ferroacidibacillus organovorans]KYP79491.1 hypothetical protein AYJ22_04275 [Ferroacidibacillus organovorans]OAG94541.1 hypothetical protein AYW79_05000 [Ferroacidibacillus organovorans]OPG15514.1 hypothetical protein B2M26_10530 [Ferroacidibacillus organovorans]
MNTNANRAFPWKHVTGFVLSIALTLLALWMVQAHVMGFTALISVTLLFAALQILVQLFLFMHITDSPGPRYHVIALALGLLFTFTIVAGSIWIMTFGGNQAY